MMPFQTRYASTPLALAAMLLLAACALAQVPPAGTPVITPVITVASASFHGSTSTQIFADGTLTSINATPGNPPVKTTNTASPDAYTRAAAVIAAEAAVTKLALKPHPDQCLDYGTDQVTATPPIAGFAQIFTACPDKAMTALMDHFLDAIATK